MRDGCCLWRSPKERGEKKADIQWETGMLHLAGGVVMLAAPAGIWVIPALREQSRGVLRTRGDPGGRQSLSTGLWALCEMQLSAELAPMGKAQRHGEGEWGSTTSLGPANGHQCTEHLTWARTASLWGGRAVFAKVIISPRYQLNTETKTVSA